MHKTAKISTIIEVLEQIQSDYGDLPVVFSRDEEGNGYNTFSPIGDDCDITKEKGFIIVWPHEERLDLDEIEGYDANDTEDEDVDDYDEEDEEYTIDDYMSDTSDY